MITKGLWRHPNCLDVDFLVTKVAYQGEFYSAIKVLYVYRNSGNLVTTESDRVTLSHADFKLWRRIGRA